MGSVVRIGLFALALNTASISLAQEQKYTSPKGYSFSYPPGWILVTELSQQELREDVRQWVEEKNFDLEQVDALLLAETTGDFASNVNVVVTKEGFTPNESSAEKLRAELPKQYQRMGMGVGPLTVKLGQAGINPAIIVEFDVKAPLDNKSLQERQYFMRSGRQGIVVTCTAAKEEFEQYAPQFESIVATFELKAPNFWDNLNPIVRSALLYGIIGGVVGGGMHVFQNLAKGKKK